MTNILSKINCFRYGGADTGDRTMVSSQLPLHIPLTFIGIKSDFL